MTDPIDDDEEMRALVADAGRAPAPGSLFAERPSTFMGIAIGVGRTIQLDRRMGEEEWDQLIVLLRDTFHARGEVREHGSLRQWTNGNLQVLLEPTATGDRVRMRTRNGTVQALLAISAALLGVALFSLALGTVRGLTGSPEFVDSLTALGVVGAGAGLWGAFRLAIWAPKRLAQMDEIARQLSGARDD